MKAIETNAIISYYKEYLSKNNITLQAFYQVGEVLFNF